ncbi:MAG: DUF4832 domain-containing protein, partial [Deltaproteobacteria bacterium]
VLSLSFVGSSDAILNPERGFFSWVDLLAGEDLTTLRPKGYTLGFAVIRLDDYRSTALPASLLNDLSTALGRVRAAHLKVILRFAYNYPGSQVNGSATQDAPVSMIVQHAGQLQPVLAANVDVIAAVQAGFIGQWAEWHDSSSGLDNAASRLQVMNAVLAAVPTSRYVLIRYPYEKRENWQGPLTAATAFGSMDAARIGHHNDCFLAGDDDTGTYHSDDDKAYLAADTFYVPLGGETCAVATPRTLCPTATAELQKYHWAFLNADFDLDVLASWKPCIAEVTNRLGYRLSIVDAEMNLSTSVASPALTLNMHLRNDGYARLYNERPVYLSVMNAGARKDYLLKGVDPRRWDPGATATVNLTINLTDLAAGTYTVALWLPDAAASLQSIPDYAVQLANIGVWDAASGTNVLTRQFVVQ